MTNMEKRIYVVSEELIAMSKRARVIEQWQHVIEAIRESEKWRHSN